MDINAEAKSIQGFVDRGNYHAAYNIALSGLNECRRNEDHTGVDRFLAIIRGIVDTMTAEYGSKEPVGLDQ